MIVDLEAFNGPLELLLNLIDKDKIDIYDIPINHITESYLESIQDMGDDSDDMIDFIVMASTLIELKSKMLLPKKEEDEEDPRDDLVERLLEYKKAKEAARLLREKKEQADLNFSKLRSEIIFEEKQINLNEDIELLSKIFFQIMLEDKEDEFEKDIISSEEFIVEDYIIKILTKLNKNNYILMNNEFFENKKKGEIIVFFLATLEIVKNSRAFVEEKEDGIILTLRNENNDGE